MTTGSGDPTVPDDAKLWRRVPPSQVLDGVRPSSAAFGPHPEDGKTSVCVAELAGTPEEMMTGWDDYWLVEFTARDARSAGFEIEVTPGEYPGHADLLWAGSKSGRKRAQQDLAKICEGTWRIRGRST